MQILKNSKNLLGNLNSRSQYVCYIIKTFHFSTLYITIPHTLLISSNKELIDRRFSYKYGEQRYPYLAIGRDNYYFATKSNKYKQDEIIQMDLLIDNIFILCGGRFFQQTIDIQMCTNCAPLIADQFLQAYKEDFLQWLLKNKDRKLVQTFHSSVLYIDGGLSLTNSRFGDYLNRIYPNKLEATDTPDTQRSASCLAIHIEIGNEGRLKAKLRQTR